MSLILSNAKSYTKQASQKAKIKAPNKKHCPTESEEQIALFEWAALNEKRWPELERLHHIPNGGKRHIATAKKLRREGVKPGVPDICLPVPRRGCHGLYIELKRMTGRITREQAEWLNALKQDGYFAVVAYGFDAAKGFIEWYLEAEHP